MEVTWQDGTTEAYCDYSKHLVNPEHIRWVEVPEGVEGRSHSICRDCTELLFGT